MIMQLVYEGHCQHICRVFYFFLHVCGKGMKISVSMSPEIKVICFGIRSLNGMIVEILIEKEFTCRSLNYNCLPCLDTVSAQDSFCSLKKEV